MGESDWSDFEAAIKAADSMSDGDAVALANSVVTDRRADYCSIEAADLTRQLSALMRMVCPPSRWCF